MAVASRFFFCGYRDNYFGSDSYYARFYRDVSSHYHLYITLQYIPRNKYQWVMKLSGLIIYGNITSYCLPDSISDYFILDSFINKQTPTSQNISNSILRFFHCKRMSCMSSLACQIRKQIDSQRIYKFRIIHQEKCIGPSMSPW